MAEEAGAGAGAGATTEVAGEWRHESGYILTNDPERVDLEALHRFLSTEAYWSVDITKERVALAVKHSVPFSLLSPTGEFVGFCRLNTDHVTFTYLSDVYVDKRHRKRGLSKWFLDHILATDYVTNVRSVFLMTKSAQKLYAKFGFEVVENRCMVYRPGVAKDVGRYDWRLVESAPLVPHAFEEVGHLHRHQLWVEVLANHCHAQVFVQLELVHA